MISALISIELKIALGVIGLLLLVGIVFLLVFFFKKTSQTKKPLLVETEAIIGLIGRDNIVSVEQVQSRVRIEVKDLKRVKLEELKEYTNGIFTSKNRLVVTFKTNTEEIVKDLRGIL
ncbi:MAG: PTS transporter subunit EIIB [Acholeplasmataceae bacterium]|jgi:phosphotransferase system IIB component|nr:PTS transporter subunit EIIB [Acholeplasmataceae bacterium]